MNPAAVDPELVEAAEALVRRRTGLVFSDTRRPAFAAGLARCLARVRPAAAASFLGRLDRDAVLLDDLVAEITVGETYFFRDPDQIDVLRHEILPSLLSGRAPSRPLRLWSAGCASGEEAYTLAILLEELGAGGAAHVVGTDLSRRALARASRARYRRWSLRGVPAHVLAANFKRERDRYVLRPGIRSAVRFGYLNLAEDQYPSLSTGIWGMDLILCRNVLIYFDAATVARVAHRLIDALADDGWLVLGASDPPLGEIVACDVAVTRAGLAYRRPGVANGDVTTRPAPVETVPVVVPIPEPRMAVSPVTPPAERASQVASWYAAGEYGAAADLAERLLRRDGEDPALWVTLVRALANRGDLEAAGRSCAAALARHGTDPELVYLHAVLLSEAGHYADAAHAARRALYLDRDFCVAHLALGAALSRVGDVEGARRAFRNAERLLAAVPDGAPVRGADGEPAARLAGIARTQQRLLARGAA